MPGLDHHLLRRGLDVARHAGALVQERNHDKFVTPHPPSKNLADLFNPLRSGASAVVLIVSAVLLVVLSLAIKYTYGLVVATLTCVEDPPLSVYLAVHESEAPPPSDTKSPSGPASNEPLLQADVVTGRPQAPITSNLKKTIQHLRARAGPWSRFRGLQIYLVWLLGRAAAVHVVSVFLPLPLLLNGIVSGVAAEVAVAGVATAWIHTVIAEPLSGPVWLRVPGSRVWKQVAPAAAVKALASELSTALPLLMTGVLGLFRSDVNLAVWVDPSDLKEPSPRAVAAALGFLGLSLALTVLVEIPATVAMVRIAASLLPDHVESIVPFDRSFGGRALPDEGGRLSILEAWTTFTWSARKRLAKVLLKVFGMIMMLGMTFAAIFAGVQLATAHNML